MPPSTQGVASPVRSQDGNGGKPKPLGLVLDQTKPDQPIRVKQVVAGGSAAENGGIQVGDELIRVDGRTVTELDVAGATELIFDPSSRNRWSATPERTVKPTGVAATAEKKNKGQPCGVGMTVMDEPPHVVTYLAPNGPAHRSHAIEVGDNLVAIDKELVADMEMEEVVQRVIGEEGTEVDLWLERVPKGGQSHAHHECGSEIRAQLQRLASLHQDGLLDKRTWRTEVEKCWKGCYSVRLTRGVAYSGEHEYQQEGNKSRSAEASTPDEGAVTLSFYRPAARREFNVVLPRPTKAEDRDKDTQHPDGWGRGLVSRLYSDGGGQGGKRGGQSESRPAPSPSPEPRASKAPAGLTLQTSPPPPPLQDVEVVAFVGEGDKLGMGLARSGATVVVTGVAPDGAAATCASIQQGDEVVAVDDQAVTDVNMAADAIAGGPDRHVTLTLFRPPAKGRRENKAGGPQEGSFKVVLPRPDRKGCACSCVVCAAVPADPAHNSAPGTPASTARHSWTAFKPQSPAKSPKERELNAVEQVGSMLTGLTGLFGLFKSPPSTPKRAGSASSPLDATRRKDQDRARRDRERQAAAEAAEKLKDLLREWTGNGHLCSSDDTDSILHDSRWRVMIDVDDEDDWKWLYNHHLEDGGA